MNKIVLYIYNFMNQIRKFFLSMMYFLYDTKHLRRVLKNQSLKDSLERQITVSYHSIEKGLCKSNFRYGFGNTALNNLMNSIRKFRSNGFPEESDKYKTALSVLKAYIDKHFDSNVNIDAIREFYEIYKSKTINTNLGGTIEYYAKDFINISSLDFISLVNKRTSVRNYSDEEIDINDLYKAIKISMKSPSACNRQPWRIRIINNIDLINQLISLQGGLSGDGMNLKSLIIITTIQNYLSFPKERYQGFIDSGMFSMTLIYTLTQLGYATCPLNSNFSIKIDKTIKKILKIRLDESLVMFISVGRYPNIFKSPVSQRDSLNSIVKYYD